MTDAKRLSDAEKASIDAYTTHGLRDSDIAAIIGRHLSTITRQLQSKFILKTKKKKIWKIHGTYKPYCAFHHSPHCLSQAVSFFN